MIKKMMLLGAMVFCSGARAESAEVCIAKLQLKQFHYTLDLWEHAKDAMNAVEFEIPVDCRYYNKLTIGSKLSDEFRFGSLVINGSFGEWSVKVVGKRKGTM